MTHACSLLRVLCNAVQEKVTLDGDDLLGECLDQLSSVGVVLLGEGGCGLM